VDSIAAIYRNLVSSLAVIDSLELAGEEGESAGHQAATQNSTTQKDVLASEGETMFRRHIIYLRSGLSLGLGVWGGRTGPLIDTTMYNTRELPTCGFFPD
jgi:hypothetical protein